jgi:hypothetical protein
VPGGVHGELVGVKFGLCDGAVVGPEMGHDVKACDVTKSDGGVTESADVDEGDGGDELVAESFIDVVVGAEYGLIFFVLMVDFCDLCS